MSERRRATPRVDERGELKVRWEENCKRRKAGWPPTPEVRELLGEGLASYVEHRFDEQGNPVTTTLRGDRALIASRKLDQDIAKQHTKVKSWNGEISGKDVMEVLELAGMLTNDPAYDAAQKAMRVHRLNTGGLKRAFLNLLRRHHERPEYSCIDNVTWYMEEYGFNLRRAVEHVVASQGIPGTSFDDAVDKVRKAYAKRGKHEAERQRYRSELAGQRSPGDSR
jgi:hypothetical protein